jgi:hypothetical protein
VMPSRPRVYRLDGKGPSTVTQSKGPVRRRFFNSMIHQDYGGLLAFLVVLLVGLAALVTPLAVAAVRISVEAPGYAFREFIILTETIWRTSTTRASNDLMTRWGRRAVSSAHFASASPQPASSWTSTTWKPPERASKGRRPQSTS